MKISCGTDIIEIERIKQSVENYEEKFKANIYTKKEVEYCESRKVQKYQHYAARFAAKEAIFKAISTLVEDKFNLKWNDFEILNTVQGRPYVNILGLDITNVEIDVSLSHIKEYAIATAVVKIEK